MKEVKYIYFEETYTTGLDNKAEGYQIEHENVLLLKPHTNSSGIWGHTNATPRPGTVPKTSWKEQYWIDLEKLNEDKSNMWDAIRNKVNIVMDRLEKRQ